MAVDFKHSYTGPYKFNQDGDFYIHRHAYCIGKAMNGPAMEDSSLAKIFSSQKTTAANAAKTYYQTLFIDSLHLTEDDFNILKESFDTDSIGLIQKIDELGKQKMSDLMDRNSLRELLLLKTSAAESAKKLFSPVNKKSLESFNNVIDALIKTVNLMSSEYGDDLAQLLSHMVYKRHIGVNAMGQKLFLAINNFAAKHKIMDCNDEHIKKAVSAISTFAKTLSTGKTSTKENVTDKNIVNIVDSLFDPFSEIIGSVARDVVDGEARKIIGKLTGTNAVKATLTDTEGKIVGNDGIKAAGKTDFVFENVVLELQHQGEDPNQFVTMKIGISNKLYRSYGFFNGKGDISKMSFGSGSGGTLQEAIEAVFPGERTRTRYLAYNALGHWGALDLTTAAINDLLLTRQITRMFATRGGTKDFSQYIFVNGEVVSILDLLLYIADPNTNLGKSSSQIRKNTTQAAAISIAGRPALAKAIKIQNAAERSKEVNKIVNTSTISAYVHVDKLVQALQVQK